MQRVQPNSASAQTVSAQTVSAQDYARGFPPLVSNGSRVLVLGTMPGQRSLQAQAYYAHPRNLFWPLMSVLFGVDCHAVYTQRCDQLLTAGVALWDVVAGCERPGSLDSDIELSSAQVNPLGDLLLNYPQIQTIAFNGKFAQRLFLSQWLRQQAEDSRLLVRLAGCEFYGLPSTSPANASQTLGYKWLRWRQLQASIKKNNTPSRVSTNQR